MSDPSTPTRLIRETVPFHAAATYPRRLDAPRRDVALSRPVKAWLVGVLLLALVPRALMAWKLDTICSDGALYIYLGQALEAGNVDAAFRSMGINVYPVVLAALHQLGLDWELAGKLWGVAMATLAVLPMFGLFRRQFDDYVALLGCALYAVHPKMIEWSPELIRDQTFWFLVSLAAYMIWRAVSEARVWLYVAASIVALLSAMARFEGVFLLSPLLIWSFWRWARSPEVRWRIAAGLLLSLVGIPLVLLVVNFAILPHHSRFELFGLAPARRAAQFLQTLLDGSASQVPNAALVGVPRMHLAEMNWVFLDAMQRGLGPVFALLMFGGIAAWWRVWLRADSQGLFWYGMAVAAGAWIHLWHTQEISSRYALSIVVLGGAYAALGLISLSRVLSKWLARTQHAQHAPTVWARAANMRAVLGTLLVLISILGWVDALSSGYESRQARAVVGRWIRQQFDSNACIVGSADVGALVGYYSRGSFVRLPLWADSEALVQSIEAAQPDIVVLSASEHCCDEMLETARRLGYQEAHDLAPPAKGRIVLLVRSSHRVASAKQ